MDTSHIYMYMCRVESGVGYMIIYINIYCLLNNITIIVVVGFYFFLKGGWYYTKDHL